MEARPAALKYLASLSEQRDLIQALRNSGNGGAAEVHALADALERTSLEIEQAVLAQVNAGR